MRIITAITLGVSLWAAIDTHPIAAEPYWTDQGWTAAQKDLWYGLSQGSRLVPLEWFRSVPDATTGLPFGARENMARFGYPYMDDAADLPIGFVLDRDESGQNWVGMNCAACHTSRLVTQGAEVLVHGGQTMADFRLFLTSLTASISAVSGTPEGLKSLAKGAGEEAIARLSDDLSRWSAYRARIDRVLEGTEDWGPGRSDAVSYIQAAAAAVVELDAPEEVYPANAPVNPPPAWNANQQERLQHNGLVSNGPDLGMIKASRVGAYLRNYTEALGVFADVRYDVTEGISSSIKVGNLLELERTLMDLQSPRWPEVFGAIDAEKAEAGQAVYARECAQCHAVLAPGDVTTELPLWTPLLPEGAPFIRIQPVVNHTLTSTAKFAGISADPALIGTDPAMVCNFLMHSSATGKLNGQLKANTLFSLAFFDRFRAVEPTTEILAALVIRDLKAKIASGELLGAYAEGEMSALSNIVRGWFDPEDGAAGKTYSKLPQGVQLNALDAARASCAAFAQAQFALDSQNYPYPGYKTRPLNGIWSTPPYLHNGSVPSLRDLLLPQVERPKRFNLRGAAFDPVNVGLVDIAEAGGFRVFDDAGQPILGNWNGGHEYGVTLGADEKDALLEYLKGL